MTDSSPRLRAALKYMVYGREHVLDVDRLIDLLGGLESFAVASSSARGSATGVNIAPPSPVPALPAPAFAMSALDLAPGGGAAMPPALF